MANKMGEGINIVVRIFHWCTVSVFLLLMITGINDSNNELHIILGYLITSLILSRVAWGFWGNKNALWFKYLHSPKSLINYLNTLFNKNKVKFQLHNPAGSYMIITMLVLLTVISLTGALLEGAFEFSGILLPLTNHITTEVAFLIKDWHELLAYLMLALVSVHIAGVMHSSRMHNTNLLKMMIIGKPKPTEKYE